MSNTLLHALISPLYTSGVKEAGIFLLLFLVVKKKEMRHNRDFIECHVMQ